MSDSKQRSADRATDEPADASTGADRAAPKATTADARTTENGPVALIGFPPKKHPRGVRRLYEGPGSPTHVEIKVADIVDPPKDEDKHAREPGQVVLWVRRDARIVLRELPVLYDLKLPRWPRR